ncbi:MAG TPA: prolyl oligopeptidase family serine peptidase [Acidimicrobiales bacterium]|nr:prolyl oligopeptidase family serine peptidase [Acidimicrobiales bacterium]
MSDPSPEPTPADTATDSDDPYLWLEDVTGDVALDWVRARNADAFAELTGNERYDELKAQILEALDADDRIPYVARRSEHLYNFWRDAAHPRGLWRRTTLESYRNDEPEWDVLLDLDALAADEDENWVWQGATVLRPEYRRGLIELSRGGADANVVREFDLDERAFVPAPEGFTLPEAKTSVGWIDVDHLYVGTDFGPGSLTSSGYPRIAKRWTRGTSLDEAVVVFEGKPDDVAVYASHDPTEGFERDFVGRSPDFFTSEEFVLRPDGSLVKVDVPDDATTGVHREWLTISLRTAWAVGGSEYPAGSLLAVRFDDFLAGDRNLTVLFEPDEHTSLSYDVWTRHHLVVGTMSDVKSQLHVLTPPPSGDGDSDGDSDAGSTAGTEWAKAPVPGVPELVEAQVVGTNSYEDDEFFLDSQSFTEPSTLRRGVVGQPEAVEVLKRAPSRWDATGVVARQHFATSEDGTQIPYFVVGPEDPSPATGPTLMTGYGGFEIPLTPSYSAVMGRGWLARGGTYVVANIRGGGEYGPTWHIAALRENRHRAYEDFAAVARDLVDRGITTPERLGIQGGSNGGLLMGVMLTNYPELFGAIAIQVPLLDMRRYHLLLAGASWMAEYGDPDDPNDWAFLQTFSPYHLLEAGRTYPPVLFVTSTRDDRVHPGHARKMMARASELGLDVRYYENIEGGHGAAADNEQAAVMWALVLEFLWQKLGSGSD